ncbi:unnamed protein product [Caenorhabditis auriculariae]|uniref:Uncharacterized protein n=1 Tax=Caenorhabditis auriculariae TaxID=2777116 RepID=A0A8S1HFP5_9PELO|nr:unnamed protein product [Caenorhabditis auriculariae]
MSFSCTYEAMELMNVIEEDQQPVLTRAWSPLDNELRIETLWVSRPRQPEKSSSKVFQRAYGRARSLRL